MSWLFEVDSVGKRFRGRRVLNAASVRAPAGAVTFLVGRNGCGKSTILRIATGYLVADSGFVRLDGRTFLHPRLASLARLGLLYIPDRDLLSNGFSVRAQLDLMWRQFGRAAGGLPAGDVAERVGLGRLVERRPGALSEGERRRAEMALAIARNPCCLLADEPFRHLSPADAGIVHAELRALADRGCAVVVTGHEVAFLFDVADRVTWCTSGTTYDLGTSAEARAHHRFSLEYLGGIPGGAGGGGGAPRVDSR